MKPLFEFCKPSKNFTKYLLTCSTALSLTLSIPQTAHAASTSGHMHLTAYELMEFEMNPLVAMMFGMYNESVDHSIATSAFTFAVGEMHFSMRTAIENGTFLPQDIKNIVNDVLTFKDRVLGKGTVQQGDPRGYSRINLAIKNRNWKEVAAGMHTIVDLMGFHVGYSQTGHSHHWTVSDEITPEKLSATVINNAQIAVFLAALDTENVMFPKEFRDHIMGDYDASVLKNLDIIISELQIEVAKLENAQNINDKNAIKSSAIKLEGHFLLLSEKLTNLTIHPAKELEAKFWADAGNASLREQLPVRGTLEFFNKFALPEILNRGASLGLDTNSVHLETINDYIAKRHAWLWETLDPANGDQTVYDPSGQNNKRNLIPANITKDLVTATLKSELLTDLLKEIGEFKPDELNSKEVLPNSLAQKIVSLIYSNTSNDELFLGTHDILNFEVLLDKAFGKGYGNKMTSLQFLIAESESKPAKLTKVNTQKGFIYEADPNHLTFSYWTKIKLHYHQLLLEAAKQNDQAMAQQIKDKAVNEIVDFYLKITDPTQVKAFPFITQEITSNLVGRIVPLPETWGKHTQTFNKIESDTYVVKTEQNLILEQMVDKYGYGLRYSWNPKSDKKAKIIKEYIKEQREKRKLADDYDPNYIKKLYLWFKNWNKVDLVNAENYILVSPGGFLERTKFWVKSIIFVGYHQRWGTAPTSKGFNKGGLKEMVGPFWKSVSDTAFDLWKKSKEANTLMTPEQYEKDVILHLANLQEKYNPNTVATYGNPVLKLAESIKSSKVSPMMCTGIFNLR